MGALSDVWGNIGCPVFKEGIQNQLEFWLKKLNIMDFVFVYTKNYQKVPKSDFQSQL